MLRVELLCSSVRPCVQMKKLRLRGRVAGKLRCSSRGRPGCRGTLCRLKAEGAVWGYDLPYLLTGIMNSHPSSAIKFIKDGRTDYSRLYHELSDVM